jgi:hypothetical protein
MDDGVELPGSSYDQIVRIIQGYQRSSVDQKFSNSDVEKSTGVAASDVSRNGKFLVQVGVLEGSQRKYLSEAGSRLCRAYQFDLAREVSEIWRKLLATTDFTSKMISAVRIRKGMDLKDFQAHVAYSAGSNKTNIKTGAAAFVRLLEIANLVSTENGIVAALPASDSAAS